MKQQISQDSDELADITPKIISLVDKLKEIEAAILDVGGIDYKTQKDTLEKLGQQVSQVERQLTRYKSTLENSEQNVRKCDLDISSNETAITSAEAIIQELQVELDKNDEAGKKILQEI